MGAFGASYATLPEEMRTELKVAHTEIINWLSKTLEAGKDEKAITFDTSAAEMADLITASMMSSLILERISSRDMTSEIARNLIKGLEEK
jgi:hypothetical protein